jgi:hypothetical protein
MESQLVAILIWGIDTPESGDNDNVWLVCAMIIITTRQCLERNTANRSIWSATFNSYEMFI